MQMQMKRMKALKMHTKVNHKYLTMKQLSQKVAAKARNEARHKYKLKKKEEEIAVNFRL